MSDDPTPNGQTWVCRNGRPTARCVEDCPVAAGCGPVPPAPSSDTPSDERHPGEQRPGGWVEGIGWVAGIDDLDDNDLCARSASELDDPRTATSWRAAWCPRQQPFIVTRWADGTVPAPASPQRPQADGALWGAIRPFLTRFASAYSEDDKTARAHLDVLAQEIAEAAAAALPVRDRADEVVVRGRVCGADSLPIAGHSVEWLNGCVTVDVAFPAPWPKGVAIGGDATVILTQPAAADPGAGGPTCHRCDGKGFEPSPTGMPQIGAPSCLACKGSGRAS